MNRKLELVTLALVVLSVLGTRTALAQSRLDTAVTYQGQLKDGGVPVDGACDMVFTLWSDAVSAEVTDQVGPGLVFDGRYLYPPPVQVNNGLFTVDLDFGDVYFSEERWLQVTVRCPHAEPPNPGPEGYVVLSPRQRIAPAPFARALPGLTTRNDPWGSVSILGGYAHNWIHADVVSATISGGGGDFSVHLPAGCNSITDDFGTIGGGGGNQAGDNQGDTQSAAFATVAGGKDNKATGNYTTIAGDTGNTAGWESATVGGGGMNRADGWYSVIGGGQSNQTEQSNSVIAGGEDNLIGRWESGIVASVIGGGTDNGVTAAYATIGGTYNYIDAPTSTIGGGEENHIYGETAAGATIAGGRDNVVRGWYGTVGGGTGNVAVGQKSTISGGDGNDAEGDYSIVGGGWDNRAIDESATIGGGWGNIARGVRSTIGDGGGNTTDNEAGTISGGMDNYAEGRNSTIAGGSGQFVTGEGAAVGGGANNSAGGLYATVPGGQMNQADADHSLAAGRRAVVRPEDTGTFVWADSTNEAFTSTGANQFLIRATGGVGIGTAAPTHPLEVGTDSTNGNGAHVTIGGMWTNGSDRDSKSGFKPADRASVLAKVVALPVSTWQYKGEPDNVHHIGPMAQDFFSAFGLGGSDKHIGTADADGVALAAIQGLHELIETQHVALSSQQAQISVQQKRIAELTEKMIRLEQQLSAATSSAYKSETPTPRTP